MPTILKNGKLVHISVEEYNNALALYRKNVLGIDETTGKLKHYNVEDLGKVWINGQEFTGIAYQGLMTVNTKTYVEEPTRSNDGSIPNINDYDTFIVPRCTVNFKYFNIKDYQRLCDAVQSNEFTVRYYDKQFNEFVVHKMYCEPEEMVNLYNVGTDVFGVLDYEVSFIGTLNDLDEYTVTYNANGGSIAGSPTQYNSTTSYSKGDRVYISQNDQRYFEAIFYENRFSNIPVTNTTYWKEYNVLSYSSSTTYTKGQIVYNNNAQNGEIGYYYAIYPNSSFSGRPLSDTAYWQRISVSSYDEEKTYSSNKTSSSDTTFGDFILSNQLVYEAIFYNDTFDGIDPTNTTYWRQLALGEGVTVRWGNSIVVADPEELFDAPENMYSNSWTTNADGTGFTYYSGQSLNVFRNLTLYAKWQTGESNGGN